MEGKVNFRRYDSNDVRVLEGKSDVFSNRSKLWNIRSAYKNIRWIEDTLIKIKSGEFSLPGKKALKQDNTNYELILIDATEIPIERPRASHFSNKNNLSVIYPHIIGIDI